MHQHLCQPGPQQTHRNMLSRSWTLSATSCAFLLSALSTTEAFVVTRNVPSYQTSPWSLPANRLNSEVHSQRDTVVTVQPSTMKSRMPMESFLFSMILGFLTAAAPLHLLNLGSPSFAVANAAESKIVGSFSGSGLFFKDTLQIEVFDDPKVQGVKLYVSNFVLPITERLSNTKNLFSDPTSASLTCSKQGRIKIADTIVKGPGGEQVFEESKSLLFKSLKVQRVYDEENQTLVYVSYNTRLDKNDDSNKSRFKSSICAIGIE
jgi:catabolite regulation protein CreA